MQNDLAVRVCLELYVPLDLLAQDSVIVNLAIDGQKERIVLVGERLRAAIWISISIASPYTRAKCIPMPTILSRS
jgi:hypothetical protein